MSSKQIKGFGAKFGFDLLRLFILAVVNVTFSRLQDLGAILEEKMKSHVSSLISKAGSLFQIRRKLELCPLATGALHQILCVLTCFFINSTVQGTVFQKLRPYTVDDYMSMKWLTSAQISADGSQILYTVDESNAVTDQQTETIWVISTTGGAAIKVAEVNPPASTPPAFSPDSKQIAFASGQENNEQIWLVNVGGKPVKITSGPHGVQSFAWSPNGTTIAFVMVGSVKTQQSDTTSPLQSEAPQLFLVDVKTKQVRQLTQANLPPRKFSWSPDSKQIAFTAQDDIHTVAIANGQTTKLVSRPGQDVNPSWSPDGSKIVFFTNYGQTNGPRGLSVVSASGGNPQDLYQSFDPGFGNYPPWFCSWSADGKAIYSSGLSRMSQHLYALDSKTASVKQVTSGRMVYHDFSFSRNGNMMAFLASDAVTPDEVYVSPTSSFKPVKLTTTNHQLAGVSLGLPEAVRWKSKDGLEIEGLLLKPYGYVAGKRYPLVVLMEGTFGTFDFSFTGRVSADDTRGYSFPFQQQILAGQGYLVLMPNPRGSWGYGSDFGKRALGDFGIGPYNDIMGGVDFVIDQGMADPERVGIMGIYVDAYRAIFATTQTNRFKAQVVGMPLFNLVSWYGQIGPEATYADRYFGGAPWQVPLNYEKISPVNFAGNIKTPTLLVSVEQPEFPPVMQAREFFTALKKNNVPMDYVVYKPSGVIVGPKSQADLLRRTNAWFDRWLKS